MSERKGPSLPDVLLLCLMAILAAFTVSFLLMFRSIGVVNAFGAALGISLLAAVVVFGITYTLPKLSRSIKLKEKVKIEEIEKGFETREKGIKEEKKKAKFAFPDLGAFAYRIFGGAAEKISPHMKDLECNLRRALIRSTAEKYIAKMILVTIVIFAATVAVTAPILIRWVAPIFAVGMGLSVGAIASAVGFMVMYIYPSLAAGSRRSKIDASLNFTTQYMAILAGAEVTPERIFKSLMKSDVDQVIKDEIGEIIKRMDIFGEDFYTALNSRIMETPSRKFSDLLKGMLAVGSMGGNLRRYLHLQGKTFMRQRRIDLKRQLDGLGILAEIYISMGVVLPIIIIIMLATMSFIGSSGIDSLMWMYITTFVLIPATSALMLLVIDTSVPKEE
ncbi:MAG: type II secretion system F family protein [Candidatus Verstraetearchaeota archaeon]|nr:type II secretion system F family protein [Candidatus Verstraetearchaeota archaeon]